MIFIIQTFRQGHKLQTPNRNILENVLNQIETIYKQIKKNEQAPKTEYLFQGINKKRVLERSLKQMELVNSIVKNGN